VLLITKIFFWFFSCEKEKNEYFFATFLEKVAQKAAFRETHALPVVWPPGRLTRIAQGQASI
jgi:hypothetical protein